MHILRKHLLPPGVLFHISSDVPLSLGVCFLNKVTELENLYRHILSLYKYPLINNGKFNGQLILVLDGAYGFEPHEKLTQSFL